MLKLINSDERWVRAATLCLSVVLGALIWEIIGWQFNPSIMVPFIGGEGHPGALPKGKMMGFFCEEARR